MKLRDIDSSTSTSEVDLVQVFSRYKLLKEAHSSADREVGQKEDSRDERRVIFFLSQSPMWWIKATHLVLPLGLGSGLMVTEVLISSPGRWTWVELELEPIFFLEDLFWAREREIEAWWQETPFSFCIYK